MLIIAFRPADVEASRGFASGGCEVVAAFDGEVPAFGASRVHRLPADLPADAVAAALVPLAAGATVIAAPSSMRAKDVLPRLAGLLRRPLVADAVARDGDGYERAIYAGALIETVVPDGSHLVVFRAAAFPAAGEPAPNGPEEALAVPTSKVEVVSRERRATTRPDLSSAKRVVSGGRPLKDSETFERVLGGFADAIGAAVGATRAAVDSGIAPNELQVGQTGKIVAPELYIAAGVSGSTQHMAGIKDSKVIVAINKDPDAPIFAAADLGLVADLYEALPRLTERYRERGHGA